MNLWIKAFEAKDALGDEIVNLLGVGSFKGFISTCNYAILIKF
jgi:hypothetical protein